MNLELLIDGFDDEAIAETLLQAPFSMRLDLSPAKPVTLRKAQEVIGRSKLIQKLRSTQRDLLEATLLMAWDCLDESHEIVQDIDNETGALIHCLNHRIEGDLGNCAYWYRRCINHEMNKTMSSIFKYLSLSFEDDCVTNGSVNIPAFGSHEGQMGNALKNYKKFECAELIKYIVTRQG